MPAPRAPAGTAVLASTGDLAPPDLFASFVRGFGLDRGYGAAVRDLRHAGGYGGADHATAASLPGGAGSWGDGAATRAAPIGAWAAGPDEAARLAHAPARPTHTHPEGIAGAVAVAVAAALRRAGRERLGAAWLRPSPAS